MKVSAKFAAEHFDEVASAAERGEEVEIARGKNTLVLVAKSGTSGVKRPMSELLGSWKGKAWISPDFDSPELNREIQEDFLQDIFGI